jgi:hypothetical protein
MKKLALLLAALFCMSGFGTTANAIGISIDVGDRPYYSHGPRDWARGAYWCWIPGHWSRRYHHRVWIHGHYGPC